MNKELRDKIHAIQENIDCYSGSELKMIVEFVFPLLEALDIMARLEMENNAYKAQIEKMKNCENCINMNENNCMGCDIDLSKWELDNYE